MAKASRKQVSVTLIVEQWQLDYSRRMMGEGFISEIDFLQAVLNTGLLHHIPENDWPPMTAGEKARLKKYMERNDIDPDIPF